MRKRSAYRPKNVILDTMQWVKQGMKTIDQTGPTATSLRLKNHLALEAMLKGDGTTDDIDVLIACFNVAEALAMRKLGQEYRAEITAAQDAILAMSQRGIKVKRFLFTGPEMQAVRTGMDVHNAQLDVCTVADLEKALDLVARELRARRARTIVGATLG